MYFAKSLLVGATALVAFVAAQGKLAFTDAPQNAQAGKTYTLKWSGATSGQPVTILLREGSSSDLKTVSIITSSATGDSYTWNVPANLPAGSDYALQISQGTETNYWNVGSIAGGSPSASASASASSATSSASSKVSSISSSLSSVASSLSSKLSSATATKSSVSAGVTGHSSTRNSTTVSHATLTSTKSSHSSSSTTSPSSTESSSSSSASSAAAAPSQSGEAGPGLKSNAALVLGAVAAMAYLG